MDYRNRDHRENRRGRRRNDGIPEDVKFYKHLTTFVIVNGVFMIITRGRWMPIPLFWGIGLFFHYVKAFGIGQNGFLSKDWEEERRDDYQQNRRGRRRPEPTVEEEVEEELELPPLQKVKKPTWDDKDLV